MGRGRRHAGGRALGALLLALGSGARPLHALEPAAEQPALTLELPPDLRVGQHARAVLSVRLPPSAERPLLVTPLHEGAALEIVRGRLLRSDAADPTANPLRFELPVLALAPGAAVIGARVLAYVCSDRCRSVETEARANLVVLPR